MKKTLFLFFLLCLVALAASVYAADRRLDVDYFNAAGVQPQTVETPITDYAKYIYSIALFIGALVAVASLVVAGLKYMSSAGDPQKMRDAKDQIGATLLGVGLLFGSWLIIRTINPQFVIFRTSPVPPLASKLAGGVYVCTNQQGVDNIKSVFDAQNLFDELILEYLQQPNEDQGTINILRQSSRSITEKLNFINDTKNCRLIKGDTRIEVGTILASDGSVDVNKKFKHICFVPNVQKIKGDNGQIIIIKNFYGAFYQGWKRPSAGGGITTKSYYFDHWSYGTVYCYNLPANFNDGMEIKPWIIHKTGGLGIINLYNYVNLNVGINLDKAKEKKYELAPDIAISLNYEITFPPESVEIKGEDIIVIFCRDKPTNSVVSTGEKCWPFGPGVYHKIISGYADLLGEKYPCTGDSDRPCFRSVIQHMEALHAEFLK